MKINKLSYLILPVALFLFINIAKANAPDPYSPLLDEDEYILQEGTFGDDADSATTTTPVSTTPQHSYEGWYCKLVGKKTTDILSRIFKDKDYLSDPQNLEDLLTNVYNGQLLDNNGKKFTYLFSWEERKSINGLDVLNLSGIQSRGPKTVESSGVISEISFSYQYCRKSKVGSLGSPKKASDEWLLKLEPKTVAMDKAPTMQIWDLSITRDSGIKLVGKKVLQYKLLCGKFSSPQDGVLNIEQQAVLPCRD